MGLRMVRSLRIEASKRTFDPGNRIVPSEERVVLPEDLWQNGTVEDLSQWLVKEKGLECPSVRLGVDGFALLPGQSLACLRAEDELMVSPLVPTPMALMPPDAGRPVKAPKPKKPKAIADLPGRAQPAQPAVEPAAQPPPSAPAEKPPPSNSPAAKCDVAGKTAPKKNKRGKRSKEKQEERVLKGLHKRQEAQQARAEARFPELLGQGSSTEGQARTVVLEGDSVERPRKRVRRTERRHRSVVLRERVAGSPAPVPAGSTA
eukprot:symbB.v1.2.022325.t1/scaffold1974.1/size94090/1